MATAAFVSFCGSCVAPLRNVRALVGVQVATRAGYIPRPRVRLTSVLSGPQMGDSAQASGTGSGPMFEAGASFADVVKRTETVERLEEIGLRVPTRVQKTVVPVLTDGLLGQVEYGMRVRKAREEAEREMMSEVQHGTQLGKDPEEGHADVDEKEPISLAALREAEEGHFVAPPPPVHDPYDVVMVGAETGSGKTLAYLLPYMNVHLSHPEFPLKAIVLVPTRELCAQVARQLYSYFPNAPPHVILSGGQPPDVSDMASVRIVIATPVALLNYFRFSTRPDGNDKYIVVDEADMLLSGSFLRDVERVLDQSGMKPFAKRKNSAERAVNRNRLVFVGATYPHWTGEKVKSIVTWMQRRYPSIRKLQTDALHKRSERIAESWHYLPDMESRVRELLRVLREDCADGDKVMIFCRYASGAHDVWERVHSAHDVSVRFGGVLELHKRVSASTRGDALARFRDGEVRLLVCTDVAARGLDLGHVARVVEFDFSSNVVGYLHRIGRTARAGASGFTNHFYDDVSKPLAEAIRQRSGENVPVVDGVFSRDRSFRRKLRKRIAEQGPGAVTSDGSTSK